MNKQQCHLYDEVQHIKQQMEILKSTLFSIYTAEQENIYDASTYMEAIHGSVQQARRVLEELQAVLRLISEEEADSGPTKC